MTFFPNTLPTALILAGGPPPSPRLVAHTATLCNKTIAADRGLVTAVANSLPVAALLGDLDSLPASMAAEFTSDPRAAQQKYAVESLERFSPDKDESDLELTLRWAKSHEFDQAIILGALGGRLDHCLFNAICLLDKARSLGMRVILGDDTTRVTLFERGTHCLNETPGTICSIIPLESKVQISLKGMRYPLCKATLWRASTQGLSNTITAHQATIEILAGLALVILCEPEH